MQELIFKWESWNSYWQANGINVVRVLWIGKDGSNFFTHSTLWRVISTL